MSTFNYNENLLQELEWGGGGRRPSTDIILSEAVAEGFIYDIDVFTRTISTPKFLGVKDDHQAERIFFRIDRIVNNVDLSNLMAIIQYKNSQNESYIYVVPFFDVYTESKNMKMLIPWNIKNSVTKYPGQIEFSIKFYKTSIEVIDGKNPIIYEFNTKVAKSQILEGIGLEDLVLDHTDETIVTVDEFYTHLQEIKEDIDGFHLYWTPISELT